MNTWQPVTVSNSLVDGQKAGDCFGAWQRLAWLHAEPRVHPVVPAIMAKCTYGQGTRHGRLYCIQPDRAALGLAEGQQVFPVFLPNWNAVPTSTAHGWIWLLSDKPNPPPTNPIAT